MSVGFGHVCFPIESDCKSGHRSRKVRSAKGQKRLFKSSQAKALEVFLPVLRLCEQHPVSDPARRDVCLGGELTLSLVRLSCDLSG